MRWKFSNHKPSKQESTLLCLSYNLVYLTFSFSITGFWLTSYWTELVTHCVDAWNADCAPYRIPFVLCSDLWKKKRSKTFFPCIFIASLRCRIAEGAISYCIRLHPLFSVDFFFFFFYIFSFFLLWLWSALLSTLHILYVGNSLGVHGDFLLQCRVTVG